jgi:acetyl-CoA synthase
MQKDFESVLERRLHQFINFAEGAMHLGQRNTIWIRISKNAIAAGFKLKHIGDILWSRYHADFTGLVDRVQVTIITDEAKVNELFPEAMKVYDERDARMKGLTDEAVDTFYSCTLARCASPSRRTTFA